MKLGLDGKVVLITGGSKGIGFACARAFAAEGAHVTISSRSDENLNSARERLDERVSLSSRRAPTSPTTATPAPQ